jgi:P27 family predicted phage terminase small subunit
MTSPPKPPAGLLKPSRDRWRQFWDSPAAAAVNVESDLPRLVRWIQATDEYDRAAKVVRSSRLVRGSMGQPVLNPLVAYLIHLDGILTRTEKEFGMTPAARKRLNLGRSSVDGELEDLFAEFSSTEVGNTADTRP